MNKGNMKGVDIMTLLEMAKKARTKRELDIIIECQKNHVRWCLENAKECLKRYMDIKHISGGTTKDVESLYEEYLKASKMHTEEFEMLTLMLLELI